MNRYRLFAALLAGAPLIAAAGPEPEIKARIRYVTVETMSLTRTETTITVEGVFRAPDSAMGRTMCPADGFGRGSFAYLGMQGEIRYEVKFEDSTPFDEENASAEQVEAERATARKYHWTAQRPVAIPRKRVDSGVLYAENFSSLGCLRFDPKKRRFVFREARFHTMNNRVEQAEITWHYNQNRWGDPVEVRRPSRPESLDPGQDFQDGYDPKAALIGRALPDKGVKLRDQETHGMDDHLHQEALIDYRIELRPERTELWVDGVHYEKWLPQAGPDEKTRGGDLMFSATLTGEDGKPSRFPAQRIVFELTEVSREPGVALNHPLTVAAPAPFDLAFEPDLNEDFRIAPGGQRMEREDPPAQVLASVSSFDHGAAGILRVWAELPDGRRVEGRYRGLGNPRELLLPYREKGSRVGKAYRTGKRASLADDWDAELTPRLDGKPGDGLTFYEEYRGLFDGKDRFIRLTPEKRELVIENGVGQAISPGLKLFSEASKIEVVEVWPGALAKNREVNANAGYATGGRQHGLRIELAALDESTATEERPALPKDAMAEAQPSQAGAITSPRYCQRLAVNPKALTTVAKLQWWIAHEIAHGLGVHHHGDYEHTSVRDFREWGAEVFDRQGARYSSTAPDPGPIKYADRPQGSWAVRAVGAVGGQNSGDIGCLMTYPDAYLFVKHEGKTDAYYEVPPLEYAQPPRFCTSPRGTGINDPKNNRLPGGPLSYFGDAGQRPPGAEPDKPYLKRGNCAGQMHLRDSDADTPAIRGSR